MLLKTLENSGWEGAHVIMDKAYEGDETRQLVLELEMLPVVPPKSNRLTPWEYDKEMYKRRNEVERLFRRLKGFRRIFSEPLVGEVQKLPEHDALHPVNLAKRSPSQP